MPFLHCKNKLKRAQNVQNSEFAYYASKSGKCIKQTPTPPFWGDVGVKKWSPFLDSDARSPIFGHLKIGTFGIFRHIRHIRGVQSLFGQCPNRGAANRNGASLTAVKVHLIPFSTTGAHLTRLLSGTRWFGDRNNSCVPDNPPTL